MVAFMDAVHDTEPEPPAWVRWEDNEHRLWVHDDLDDLPSLLSQSETSDDGDSDDGDSSDSDSDSDNDSDSDSDNNDGENEDEADDDKDEAGDDKDETGDDKDEAGDDKDDSESDDDKPEAEAPLRDGRICRCGSQLHLTIQHKSCPLNNNNDVLPIFPDDEHERLSRYVPRNFLYQYYEYSDGSTRKCFGKVTRVTDDGKLTIEWTDGGEDDVTEKELLKIFSTMKKEMSRKRKATGGASVVRRRIRM